MERIGKLVCSMAAAGLTASVGAAAFAAADRFQNWDYDYIQDDWYAQTLLYGEV